MKLIICGSRSVDHHKQVFVNLVMATLDAFCSREKPTEVVCGMANGPDLIGKMWADKHGIAVKQFPALWDDITVPGAVIVERKDGSKYNKRAGIDRNIAMGLHADAAIIFWDGQSHGSKNMAEIMRNRFKKPVTIIYTDKTRPPKKIKGKYLTI